MAAAADEDTGLDALASRSSTTANPMQAGMRTPEVITEETVVASYDVLCATWNVGNTEPVTLEPWLPAGGGDYDIIAVAAQECKLTGKWKGEEAADEDGAGADEDDEEAAAGDEDDAGGDDRAAALSRLQTALHKAPSARDDEAGHSLSARDLGAVAVASASAETEDGAASAASGKGRHDDIPTLSRSASTVAGQRAVRDSIASQSPFYKVVLDHLGDGWTVAALSLMYQTGLLVVVRNRVAHHVSDVEKAQEATGLLRVGTNKGGVVVAMTVSGTRLCFVGAHLAAHLKHMGRRDQDVMEVVGQVRLGGPLADVDLDARFHHVFWMGDLNYRTDWDLAEGRTDKASLTDHAERFRRTQEAIDAGRWEDLAAVDQLKHQQSRGFVFHGFREEPLDFAPTFKVKPSAELAYKGKRIPSYCDRVLYKSLPGSARRLTAGPLRAFPSVPTSDHKPVSCVFRVDCVTRPRLMGEPAEPDGDDDGAAAAASAPSAPPPPLQMSETAVTTDAGGFVLRFTDLRGHHLIPKDPGNKSDPYVRFFSDPHAMVVQRADGRQPRTTHESQTLNPRWPDDDVPDVVLSAASLTDVARSHLFLVVVDHDALDADDPMGQAVLPLDPVVRACIGEDGGASSHLFEQTHDPAEPPSGSAGEGRRFRFRLPVTLATSHFCPATDEGRPTLTGEVEVLPPGSRVRLRKGGADSAVKCCCQLDGCCSVM